MAVTQYLIETQIYATLDPAERAWRITNLWKYLATTRKETKKERDIDIESLLALPYKAVRSTKAQ